MEQQIQVGSPARMASPTPSLEQAVSRCALLIAGTERLDSVIAECLDLLLQATSAAAVGIVLPGLELVRYAEPHPDLVDPTVIELSGRLPAAGQGSKEADDQASTAYQRSDTAVHIGGVRVGTLLAVHGRAGPFPVDDGGLLVKAADVVGLGWRFDMEDRWLDDVLERDRMAVADRLHDDSKQLLYAAQMKLELLLADPSLSPRAAELANSAMRLMGRASTSMQGVISFVPRPKGESVLQGLRATCGSIRADFGVETELNVENSIETLLENLPDGITDTLLRVTREALTNIARHAGTSHAWISLRYTAEGRIALAVTDRGTGWPSEPEEGYGIHALRRLIAQHGGQLILRPNYTTGTQVLALIPTTAAARTLLHRS